MVKSAAAEAGLVLCEEIADAELPRLHGDQRRIKQILLNLLSNAIKFTPGPGTVTIAARQQRGTVVITVVDTGIGIALDDLDKALEPFGQIDNRLARAYEGTGLGLPLSKQLMEVHGGSLRLDSEPGVGTTVTLTFPAERIVPLDRMHVGGAAGPLAVFAYPNLRRPSRPGIAGARPPATHAVTSLSRGPPRSLVSLVRRSRTALTREDRWI